MVSSHTSTVADTWNLRMCRQSGAQVACREEKWKQGQSSAMLNPDQGSSNEPVQPTVRHPAPRDERGLLEEP